jgi:hypothetical protein
MRNKFAGRCACGVHVPEGAGTLGLVDDHWTVWCGHCDGVPKKRAGVRKKRPARTKAAGAWRKAKRPSGAKPKAVRSTVRRARVKASVPEQGLTTRGWGNSSPTADLTLRETETCHTVWLELPDGRLLPCSDAFARTEVARRRAQEAGKDDEEFDFVVALAELAFFGHRGEPFVPDADHFG